MPVLAHLAIQLRNHHEGQTPTERLDDVARSQMAGML
jgi:hypothetical protein